MDDVIDYAGLCAVLHQHTRDALLADRTALHRYVRAVRAGSYVDAVAALRAALAADPDGLIDIIAAWCATRALADAVDAEG